MEIQGTLKKVCPIEEIQGTKGTFTKRTIVLDCSNVDEITGEIRENIIALETSGRFCADYDAYVDHVGEKVTARFGISGRCVTNGDGQERYYNTLRIISLALDNPMPVQRPQGIAQGQAAPTQAAPTQAAPAPVKVDYNQPQEDDLPF